LIIETEPWRRYVNESLIETSISRDILLMTRVEKPALLRRLFSLPATTRENSSRIRKSSANRLQCHAGR